MGDFKYPLPVTQNRYITKLGGRSNSLQRDQIGIHVEALVQNTSLSLGNDILVDKARRKQKSTPRPLYIRAAHKLKPITELHDSRAVVMASDGEAVLSEEDPLEVEEGDEIVLKSDINQLPEDWTDRLIRKHINEKHS